MVRRKAASLGRHSSEHLAESCVATTARGRRRAGQELTMQLVLALVISRLDYCNLVLSFLPQSLVEPLQRVHNAAA